MVDAGEPLTARLRRHVDFLAGEIGERDVFQKQKQIQVLDYIQAEFTKAEYRPRRLEYRSKALWNIPDGTSFFNIEATLGEGGSSKGKIWIVGAHHDTFPGTPGADDNASGVAVLLELARIMKKERTNREIRFVAFGTEEPPSFNTRNMGSHHYARSLKDQGLQVECMISLEMLGYYNSQPGSQHYPPLLRFFFPDTGHFIGLVSNLSSRHILKKCKLAWTAGSDFPLVTAVLPPGLSSVAMSDQLNFWDAGFPALLLTDTAFYRNPHYHQHTDTPDTLNYENMAEITKSLAAILRDDEGK